MRTIAAALLIACTALAQQTPVKVVTQDGNELIGTIAVAGFKLDSSLGSVDVSMKNV